MRSIFALIWMVAASSLLVLLTEAFPAHFACIRKIKVGAAIMAGRFQQSNAVSIKLGSIPCGGTLKTGVVYTPNPRGLYAGAHYLIDVTKSSGDPFPGATFIKGAQVYDGKSSGTKGKSAVCPSRSRSFPGSKLKFSSPGKVFVRIAWARGPFQGAMISAPCQYTVVKPRGKGAGTSPAPAPAAAAAPDQLPAAPAAAAEAAEAAE
jgi:hypothetical protein